MGSASSGGKLCIVTTTRDSYTVTSRLSDGTISRVYAAQNKKGEEVIIKVVTNPDNNTLMLNEHSILHGLHVKDVPEILDIFKTEDGRVAEVFRRIPGVDANGFRRPSLHRPGTKDFYHLGWLLEHQLGLLAKLHTKMVVHGNIQPQHVLINPVLHEVRFIDFCFARSHPTSRDTIAIWTDAYSAPEIKDGVPPLPGMDIYSVGKVAVFLTGGDPETGEIPSSSGLDSRFCQFIEQLIEPNYLQRPRDARQLARACFKLRQEVFGPPQWVDCVH